MTTKITSQSQPPVVMHTCDVSIREAEAGRSLGGQVQPGLHGKTVSLKKKKIRIIAEKNLIICGP